MGKKLNSATPSKSLSVEAYSAAVAAGSPTPGGGSVAAMVASFASALAEMVCNLTLAGKSPPVDPDYLRKAAADAVRLRGELLDLATADEEAYAGYRTASALPRTTAEEKQLRRAALDEALKHAADVPLTIARKAAEVLTVLTVVAEHGTKHALTDASTGALLAEAATKSALLNVRVNADLMRDRKAGSACVSDADTLERQGTETNRVVLATVARRS